MPQARFDMNRRRQQSPWPQVWAVLDTVKDPEVPVLSVWELGVLQDVEVVDGPAGATVNVVITPTYSGCPALQQMADDIHDALQAAGYRVGDVTTRLAPAWTTDWLDTAARDKLVQYGIAAPGAVVCPQCGSERTQVISEFSSTACKSLHRCEDCAEPFEHFKRI